MWSNVLRARLGHSADGPPPSRRLSPPAAVGALAGCGGAGDEGRGSRARQRSFVKAAVSRSQAGESGVNDEAIRQCLLESLHAGIGDLRAVFERQPFKFGQPCKVCQPRIRNLSVVEPQIFQLGQPCKACQPRIGNLIAVRATTIGVGSALQGVPVLHP